MGAIEETVIKYTAQELPLLLREIMRIPSCHLSRIVPEWEKNRLIEMAEFLGINSTEFIEPDGTLTYDKAVALKREIMAELGHIFREKGELGKTRLDELREIAGV